MPKRSPKKGHPAKEQATASGIIEAAAQDIELTAEQLEEAAAHAVRRLGGLKMRQSPRGPKVAVRSRPRRLLPKRRKRKP